MAISSAVRVAALLIVAVCVANSVSHPQEAAPQSSESTHRSYLGFDRNIYPGDDALPILRKTFAFSSYWLSPPPGEKTNTWVGKRELLRSQGFGFLVLYRSPASHEIKTQVIGKSRAAREGADAIGAAKAEGFSGDTIIFLDIEEGGRLPETYHAYLSAWSEAITRAGYRPGVYCSGVPVKEEPGVSVTTADDIRSHARSLHIAFWVFNDLCPPSPGCTFPQNPPPTAQSGISYAAVWQFAQSPRRKERTGQCAATYHRDGNCYAPGDTAHAWFLDINSATSPDPSGGAK